MNGFERIFASFLGERQIGISRESVLERFEFCVSDHLRHKTRDRKEFNDESFYSGSFCNYKNWFSTFAPFDEIQYSTLIVILEFIKTSKNEKAEDRKQPQRIQKRLIMQYSTLTVETNFCIDSYHYRKYNNERNDSHGTYRRLWQSSLL